MKLSDGRRGEVSKWSLPVRECGLKQTNGDKNRTEVKSLPVRECGLKHPTRFAVRRVLPVTPRAGVWIETMLMDTTNANYKTVTPRAGVWIETSV